jgi:hypothetical protein
MRHRVAAQEPVGRRFGCRVDQAAVPTEKEIQVLPEKQLRAFGEFYKSARYNKILDPKTTLMIHLASAMSAGCYP